MKPLYIWAGGKKKMIPKYTLNPGIPLSGYDVFVEPFFGGGAMTCHIANNNPTVKQFIMNDINPEIVGIYRAIKTDVEGFLNHCDSYCVPYLAMDKEARKTFYYKVRDSYIRDYRSWTAVEESATLYFLMKTCFNGIFQSTKEAKGRFATPCGLLNHKDAVYDRANVLEWHEFLQRADIRCGDWKDCMEVEGKAFYFMDPPYRDSFADYWNGFNDDKHIELIKACKQADGDGHIVMYCNRQTLDTFYQTYQGQLTISKYDVTYTAGRRATEKDAEGKDVRTAKKAGEVLLHSASIQPVPVVEEPKKKPEKKPKKNKSTVVLNPEILTIG
jgi:DNA adenine methylase